MNNKIIVENNSRIGDDELLWIAKRDKNSKRPFLIVNNYQGKHIPVSPSAALDYFGRLGEAVAASCAGERALVIGFAETATAIGARVAAEVARSAADVVYCHTTREAMPESLLTVRFFEEHSHAVNQALYLNGYDIASFDRVIFVEDEVTTGRTILNFLRALGGAGRECLKVTIASLVSGSLDESLFDDYDATFVSLTKVDTAAVARVAPREAVPYEPYVHYSPYDLDNRHILRDSGRIQNPRAGVPVRDYLARCEELAEDLVGRMDFAGKDVLVLGTEEFMYPAMVAGAAIERSARRARFHATTRTPIILSVEPGYQIVLRCEMTSMYDPDRTTFVYNLEECDVAVVITDAPCETKGLSQIAGLLRGAGAREVFVERLLS